MEPKPLSTTRCRSSKAGVDFECHQVVEVTVGVEYAPLGPLERTLLLKQIAEIRLFNLLCQGIQWLSQHISAWLGASCFRNVARRPGFGCCVRSLRSLSSAAASATRAFTRRVRSLRISLRGSSSAPEPTEPFAQGVASGGSRERFHSWNDRLNPWIRLVALESSLGNKSDGWVNLTQNFSSTGMVDNYYHYGPPYDNRLEVDGAGDTYIHHQVHLSVRITREVAAAGMWSPEPIKVPCLVELEEFELVVQFKPAPGLRMSDLRGSGLGGLCQPT